MSLLLLLLALGWMLPRWLKSSAEKLGPPPADLFAAPYVWPVEISADPKALDSLRKNPRQDVLLTVRWAGSVFTNVQAHLKGATGSFRPVDEKPSWTLDFPKPGLLGYEKIHLNNSVEDESFLCEWLGSEIFRAAGVPAARTTHALVTLNGRKLGLYVIKEGYNRAFVQRHFGTSTGPFYEPIQAQDITGRLEIVFGPSADPLAGRRELAAVASLPDLQTRWEQFGVFLDREMFSRFLAAEVLLGHRDGYGLAHNNYRLFFDTTSRRVCFLPHGMDNLLGTPDFPWRPYWRGLVARSFTETPQGSALYRASLTNLLETHFQPQIWMPRLKTLADQLTATLPRNEARTLTKAAEQLCRHLELRHASLRRQLAEPPPSPPVFSNNIARLTGWRPVDIPEGGRMETATAPDGRPALMIRAGPRTAASWRTTVWLDPGAYIFAGEVILQGVKPLDNLRQKGAGLGVQDIPAPPHFLIGDVRSKRLEVPFTVAPPGRLVELRCELFAQSGTAWFVIDSLHLRRP